MDKYAVLTFREQPLTAEEQLAFSKQLGDIEHAIGTSLREDKDARLPSTFADVSNLDKEDRPFDINDRRRLFAIGNRLWHSDSSFKVVPAKYTQFCTQFQSHLRAVILSLPTCQVLTMH